MADEEDDTENDAPDYPKLMEDAAASGDSEKWLQYYRAHEAARGGQSTINGLPTAQVIGTPEAVAAANPIQAAAPAVVQPPAPEVVAANQAKAVERVKAGQPNDSVLLDHYNNFLADQGIDPNTIGGARQRSRMDNQGNALIPTLITPTIAQEDAARSAISKEQGNENRARIAANRLRQSDPIAAGRIFEALSQIAPQRSWEGKHQYFLNLFSKPSPAQVYASGNANPFQ
jgi:hypothetical protein